ncbi:hypothetical protein MSTHC_2282 [Methanosarcina thermophila CHTI-55]|uniref:Uncharacterized protein n=2 Tax=Methanosarcina thermophila TaxID=2210 RepID=A0A0E3NJJ3_METTE|nr:hypothetical protein MSTHC_2282 [Methanosarcina thermophila CHTI-55]
MKWGKIGRKGVTGMEISFSRSKFSWAEYFSDKKKGGHRYSTDEFLYKEAKENFSTSVEVNLFSILGAAPESS